jgi:hypothetical protein
MTVGAGKFRELYVKKKVGKFLGKNRNRTLKNGTRCSQSFFNYGGKSSKPFHKNAVLRASMILHRLYIGT